MKALALVDLQNDFMPGGALPVPRGDEVIPVANRVQAAFGLVVATQDWHPPDHGSFAANHPDRRPGEVIELAGLPQVLWPVHCVQVTPGAALVAGLDTQRVARVFHKGTDPQIDSYSAIFDNGHRQSTGLAEYLRGQGVGELYVLGVATDYCVKYTVLDALQLGFRAHVIADGCRGIDLHVGDCETALDELRRAGAVVASSEEVLRQRR